jgi:hypothetical protein
MDKYVAMVLVLVALPVLTFWGMAMAARLRGPAPPPPESKRREARLVTNAIPYDEHRDEPEHVHQQLNRRATTKS